MLPHHHIGGNYGVLTNIYLLVIIYAEQQNQMPFTLLRCILLPPKQARIQKTLLSPRAYSFCQYLVSDSNLKIVPEFEKVT